MLTHLCALWVTTLRTPGLTSFIPPLGRWQTCSSRQALSTWCPDTGPVQRLCPHTDPGAHVHGWGGQRLPLLPQAPRASHLPAVIYQKYINPGPVSIRVSIPGTVPDKPYLWAGALAPCSRACQSCCPHPAGSATLAVTSHCAGGRRVPLFRGHTPSTMAGGLELSSALSHGTETPSSSCGLWLQ